MTYGEIKIEALKLMYVRENTDFVVSQLDILREDEDINVYLCNMPGSINRCLSYIESRGVLPRKTHTLVLSEAKEGELVRRDLKKEIPDYYDIDRLICECNGRYIGDCDYRMEGDVLVLAYDEDMTYTVEYKPKCRRVSVTNEETRDDCEIDVPDDIAALIPFYIKSELYRDDEPAEAGEARNWFEQSIAQLGRARVSTSKTVTSLYAINDL